MTNDREMIFQPIGSVKSPYQDLEGMPIQPAGARGVKGKIILNPDLVDGLKDLEGFSHLLLIYFFHQSEGYDLLIKPFLDDDKHGVFATRAPRRPNKIGISVVKLIGIQGNVLEIEDIDMLDGTPVLDIKPFIPDLDNLGNVSLGWLEDKLGEFGQTRSDDRFISK